MFAKPGSYLLRSRLTHSIAPFLPKPIFIHRILSLTGSALAPRAFSYFYQDFSTTCHVSHTVSARRSPQRCTSRGCCLLRSSARQATCSQHRCRSKNIFGGAKDFCPNFSKPAQKVVEPSNFFQRCLRCDLQKWSPLVFLQTLSAIFRSQTTLGAIFAKIFWDFA